MTLFEINNIINKVAVAQPNINTIVNTGDVFDLNTDNWQIKYGAFCVQQEQHVQNGDFITYNFTLFYVDRLTDNKRNKIEVQSNAITTLMNIILGLKQIEIIDPDTNVNYQVFTQRFAAECAGAFCNIGITATTDICYDEFINKVCYIIGDFNYDFTNDFFIKTVGCGEFNNEDYNKNFNLQYGSQNNGEFSKAFAVKEGKPDSFDEEFTNSFLNDSYNKDSEFE